jgi:hypothetical protein
LLIHFIKGTVMKSVLYSTVSAAALLAVAGVASAGDGFTGVAQFSIGGGTTESGSFFFGPSDPFDNPFAYRGEARGLWPLSPSVHLQADLFAEQGNDIMDDWGDTDEATTIGGAVHLLHPFADRARFGLAGSIWGNEVFVPADSGQVDNTLGLVAVEGQFFGTDWTLMGQAGVFTSFDCSGGGEGCPFALEDGTFLRGEIKYFLTDNTALRLEAVQMWGGVDDSFFSGKSARVNSTEWNLGAEHRFEGSPFSAFVGLSHQTVEANSLFTTSAETTSASIGIKFYLDQASLKSNNRSGAELNTPTFGYAPEQAGPLAYGATIPILP